MPRLDSTRYTIAFATAVCVVCALLVSVAAVSLQPRQAANARLYMEKNVLLAAGLAQPGQDVSEREVQAIFDKSIKARLVDFEKGALVPEGEVDARKYDQRKARNDPGASRVAPPNNAGIGRIPNLAVDPGARGSGIGSALIQHAIDYMRAEGMAMGKIETLVQNERGQALYPRFGFQEVARQIHFVMPLTPESEGE